MATMVNRKTGDGQIVLIVDDDPNIRRLVAAHLKAAGFELDLAANGQEAIDQASLHQPDAIILDISMPGMNGLEALTRLREWYTEPILILSATDQERENVRALDLGGAAYVTMPVATDELAARELVQLPSSPGEAIERFAASELMRETPGESVAEPLVAHKRIAGAEYRPHVPPVEPDLYTPLPRRRPSAAGPGRGDRAVRVLGQPVLELVVLIGLADRQHVRDDVRGGACEQCNYQQHGFHIDLPFNSVPH